MLRENHNKWINVCQLHNSCMLLLLVSEKWRERNCRILKKSVTETLPSWAKTRRKLWIIIQQDATIYSLFISANCSKYFGLYLHPSSGIHTTVSKVSGIIETVTTTCRVHNYIYIYIYIYIHTHTHIYWGADKSLARPGRKQARKHVRDARDFNKIEMRAVIKFLFLQSKALKEIHAILTETLACFLPGLAKDLSAPL